MKVEHRELLDQVRPARRVLVVDDHPSFRRSARTLLEAEGFEVIGEAADGAAALAAVAELAPELVLLDVQLPDVDGFEVARRLLADDPGLPIVLVSSRDRREYGSLIDESGARGFVSKEDLSGASLAGFLE
jgi:DNA-binding NarL/FixJ family response regulator